MGFFDDRRTRKARLLLEPAVPPIAGVWADLGCGDGVFTLLLAQILPQGSKVYAVDQDAAVLQALQRRLGQIQHGVTVETCRGDFTRPLDLPPLDGLLLANSLHFVREQAQVLRRLVSLLQPGGRLVVVEYNTERGNSAVPYPLSAEGFLALAARVGLAEAEIRTRAPSTFLGEMYTGLALWREGEA